jgi:leucyl/phenylalanyl-tRNA--protein transferase
LSTERLQLAGIFPWFEDGEPITWWSPDPRMVLFLDELVVSKSMRNILNRNIFTVTNQNFRGDFKLPEHQAGWTRWDMDYK